MLLQWNTTKLLLTLQTKNNEAVDFLSVEYHICIFNLQFNPETSFLVTTKKIPLMISSNFTLIHSNKFLHL